MTNGRLIPPTQKQRYRFHELIRSNLLIIWKKPAIEYYFFLNKGVVLHKGKIYRIQGSESSKGHYYHYHSSRSPTNNYEVIAFPFHLECLVEKEGDCLIITSKSTPGFTTVSGLKV